MKEEITDMIMDQAYDDPKFKKGFVLKFANATIKITRVDRKNKRSWGEHIKLINHNKGMSHYGHIIDATQNPPFCEDCEVYVDELATKEGHKKAQDREDRTLSDGTIIE